MNAREAGAPPCGQSCDELRKVLQEAVALREHIQAVQRGSEVAQELVVKQFQEVDRVLSLLQSENALRKSLLDATDQMSIISADRNGLVSLFNRGAENILGYAAAEVTEHASLFSFHDAAEIAAVEQETGRRGIFALIALAQRGAVRGREWNYLTRDGTRVPVSLSISAVRDAEDQICGIVCSAIDISELKSTENALRASEARYRELSITDNLTQLFNVRHFYAQLEMETLRAKRYPHPLAVLVMDVDNFKSFNDSYGHPEGDRVLARLGEVIRSNLRNTDSGYRYGGEEFVVLLPETGLDGAGIVAERIRACFAAVEFTPRQGLIEHRTLSIGGAELAPGEDASGLVRRADAGTYEAKHGGKDRVVMVARPPAPS